jgi:FHS family glucose/mannose:H+ symporter-like MFS transporter
MNRLIRMGCLSYLLTGFTHVILGAVLPELLRHYNRTYQDGGMLIFAEFFGFLCGVLCMPFITRRWGRRNVLTTSFLLLFAAEAAIAFLPPWSLTIGLALLAGFAFGVIEASIGTFILVAAKNNQAVAMSKLEVAFGVGALLMPFISSFLIVQGVWAYSFVLLGASALLMAGLWSRLTFGEIDALLIVKTTDGQSNKQLVYGKGSILVLSIFMLVFFLYVGLEVAIVNFLPSIFSEKMKSSSSLATLTVTAFWLAMVVGRIFTGVLAEKLSYYRFLWIACAGGLLALIMLAFNGSVMGGFVLVLLLGLFMAGMFAVGLIFANQFLPGMTERTTSLLIASGGLGGSVLPLLIGWTMDQFAVEISLWLFAGAMLAILLFIMYSQRWKGRLVAKTHSSVRQL